MKTKLKITSGIVMALLLWTSCKKEDKFLNTKPDQALFIPSTLQDLNNLLHYENLFNTGDPSLGEIAADDYYVSDDALTGQDIGFTEKSGYIWARDLYNVGENINDWSLPYKQIYYANTVLDYLPKINASNNQLAEANRIKGSALFFRAIAFYNLLQTFALPFNKSSSATALGIPLRLTSDLNIKSTRSPIQVCYDQIISDLQQAFLLLPVSSKLKTEPSQPAAMGLLARIYLAMGDFDKAYEFANKALGLFSELEDYNSLTPTTYSISTTFLKEDIFHSVQIGTAIISPNYVAVADSTLYTSYSNDDLRKSVCFILNDGLPYFIGTYDFNGYNYSGIATDELYLIRAECSARLGNSAAALKDLNTLLITRWRTGTFTPISISANKDLLDRILLERRKELLFRGLRWTDLRRLNQESRYAKTLIRKASGQIYQLAPNSPRYAMPIPDNEIATSGIDQNIR